MPRTVHLGLIATVTLIAGAARAQSGSENALVALYIGAATSGTTLNGLTTSGIVMTVQGAAGGGEVAAATELYLRNNSLQLAQDLATGDGPLIRELATSLGLQGEKARVFGALLRQDRRQLLELAQTDRLTRDRALAFATRIQTLMASNELLRPELQRLATP